MYFSARQISKALAIFCGCGAFVAQALAARPVVLHEEARVSLPQPYYGRFDVCLHGDDMLVLANRPAPASETVTATGTHVRLLHVWDGPRWPLIGVVAATAVIGPIFIHGIASRTLAGLAAAAERVASGVHAGHHPPAAQSSGGRSS